MIDDADARAVHRTGARRRDRQQTWLSGAPADQVRPTPGNAGAGSAGRTQGGAALAGALIFQLLSPIRERLEQAIELDRV